MNNTYDVDLFCSFYPIMKDFVYHYIAYSEIHQLLDSLPGDRQFWVYTCDAHFKVAVISWTMIMGADSNRTHWKKLFFDNENTSVEFRRYLKNTHHISEHEWFNIHNDIVRFRNEFVAHKTTEYSSPVPVLRNGLTVLYALELWIRQKIHPDILEDDFLLSQEATFRFEINNTLSRLALSN